LYYPKLLSAIICQAQKTLSGIIFSHATHRLRLGQAAQRLQRNMLLLHLGFALEPFAVLA
jgi:hypothetical protein